MTNYFTGELTPTQQKLICKIIGYTLFSAIKQQILMWICHASCLYHAFHSYSQFAYQLFSFHFITLHMGSHLRSRPRHQKSSLNTSRFILDFVVDSSANYNIITKEEKDSKGPYAINTCSTKLLSSKLNLYMH